MKKGFEGLIIAAVVIIGGFFLYKNKMGEPQNLSKGTGEIIKQYGTSLSDKKDIANAVPNVAVKKMTEDKRSKYEKDLRNDGFQDNPNDPYTLIKTVKRKDGKEITYIMPKDPGEAQYLQPQDRDKKIAEEIIASKRDLNPEEEIQSLKRLDENDQTTMMMLGHFRDDSKDLEIFFGPTTDEKGNPFPEDVICLISPKLNLNFKKNFKGVVRTDDTGYAILKASDQIYARVAWSFSDAGRVLHGQVLNTAGGSTKVVTDFDAKEATRTSGKLKYCD